MRRDGSIPAIRILIVDDIPETRASIKQLLELEEGLSVVGEAGDGREAIASTRQIMPDCVLMDINMPVMDGIVAAESIAIEHPDVAVVMMSVQGEQEYLRKAMAVGARDYLVKPFECNELTNAIRRACQAVRRQRGESVREATGQVVAVLGPKGGVGRTTVAANVALALAAAGEPTCLVDLNLQFGDLAMTLDIVPKQTLASLAQIEFIEPAVVEDTLMRHKSGVRLLAGPDRPEEAELISSALVDQALRLLVPMCSWLVVDMPAHMGDLLLPVLDRRPKILLVTGPDIATVRNTGQAVRLLRGLGVDGAQVQVVLNRAVSQAVVNNDTIERNVGLPLVASIPDDVRAMRVAATKGEPVVLGQPGSLTGRAYKHLADVLLDKAQPISNAQHKRSLFKLMKRHETRWVTS